MRNSKPQRCVQQHKSLKVTRNATNADKQINEASKQFFANNLFKISCQYTQSMLSFYKSCLNVLNVQSNGELLLFLSKILIETKNLFNKKTIFDKNCSKRFISVEIFSEVTKTSKQHKSRKAVKNFKKRKNC